MSWASNRETTRPEDVAYCLLGIFDVNLPMIYGEGKKAFRRLQEEIIRQSTDLTIFACYHEPNTILHIDSGSKFKNGSGLDAAPVLASSPRDFEMHSTRKTRGLLQSIGLLSKWSDLDTEYAITNKGLRITTQLALLPDNDVSWAAGGGRSYFLALGEVHYDARGGYQTKEIIGTILNKIGPNTFLRQGGPLDVSLIPGRCPQL